MLMNPVEETKPEPKFEMIMAVDSKGGIGKDGGMPWRMSDDLKYFKRVTEGKHLIMGRKTFESLPGILPGRPHHVLTSNTELQNTDQVMYWPDLQQLWYYLRDNGHMEAMFIGGSGIFNSTMMIAMCDRFHITHIHDDYDCDTFVNVGVIQALTAGYSSNTNIFKNSKNTSEATIMIHEPVPAKSLDASEFMNWLTLNNASFEVIAGKPMFNVPRTLVVTFNEPVELPEEVVVHTGGACWDVIFHGAISKLPKCFKASAITLVDTDIDIIHEGVTASCLNLAENQSCKVSSPNILRIVAKCDGDVISDSVKGEVTNRDGQ